MKKQAFCVKLERVPGLSCFKEEMKVYVQKNSHMGTLNTSRKFNPQHFADAGQVSVFSLCITTLLLFLLSQVCDKKGKAEKCLIICADAFSLEMQRKLRLGRSYIDACVISMMFPFVYI